MSMLYLNIQIDEPYIGIFQESFCRSVVEHTLDVAGQKSDSELGLVITDDETVWHLNREYRGIDRTTDVLSFALGETKEGEDESFIMPPDDVLHLGEVIISFPQAQRQAEEHNHSIEYELSLLVAHGVLHLLGYDHENDAEREEMTGLERKVLDRLFAGEA